MLMEAAAGGVGQVDRIYRNGMGIMALAPGAGSDSSIGKGGARVHKGKVGEERCKHRMT